MAARPPPALPEELVEEILLRVPPDDPALLVRASLACKRWCRLVSGPGFRRRFRELHRSPPMLGVLRSFEDGEDGPCVVRFVPACSFRPPRADLRGWRALDARHGRVLLISAPCSFESGVVLAVWDPVTDVLRELRPMPPSPFHKFLNAAVLCAAGDCDHLDCSNGRFLVVFIAAYDDEMFAYLYSSEADWWSEPTPAPLPEFPTKAVLPVHVGNALYFTYQIPTETVKYDLGTREITLLHSPPIGDWGMLLTATEGGGLGTITVELSRLCLWSMEAGADGDMRWIRSRVIDFEALDLFDPFDACLFSRYFAALADGGIGSFITNLKSGKLKKIQEVGRLDDSDPLPYMRFCIPALGMASTGEGP